MDGLSAAAASRLGRIGLGTAALGRPAYLNSGRDRDVGAARSVDDMRARTTDVLDAAYADGIRYVDTARSYGRAEEFVADWLNSRPDADDVEVASKWGYRYAGDWRLDAPVHEVKEHTLEALSLQLHETRTLLGERLGLYQVHSITEESPVLSDAQLQNALAELRDGGLRLGFSTSGPHQGAVIRAALELTVNGAPLFSSVQSSWNLLETSAAPALAEANDGGVTVVLKEVFANGRLAPGISKEHSAPKDDSAETSAGARRLLGIAADLGIGVDQLAFAAALHQPWASRVLSGAVTVAQLESHVAAAHVELTPQTLDELGAASEDPEAYWTARSQRPWT